MEKTSSFADPSVRVRAPVPSGWTNREPPPMGRLPPDCPRREPGPVARAVEDEVGLGDRQPGPARAVGVDAQVSNFCSSIAPRSRRWHSDDDPSAVVRPVGRAVLLEDPAGRLPARRVVDPDAELRLVVVSIELRIDDVTAIRGDRARRKLLGDRPPLPGLRVDGDHARGEFSPVLWDISATRAMISPGPPTPFNARESRLCGPARHGLAGLLSLVDRSEGSPGPIATPNAEAQQQRRDLDLIQEHDSHRLSGNNPSS